MGVHLSFRLFSYIESIFVLFQTIQLTLLLVSTSTVRIVPTEARRERAPALPDRLRDPLQLGQQVDAHRALPGTAPGAAFCHPQGPPALASLKSARTLLDTC